MGQPLIKSQIIEDTYTVDETQDHFESIVNSFGVPYSRGERHAIFHGDSLELLSNLSPNCIDLTFTSPPYNIGKEYEENLPLNNYLEWCCKWINLVHLATEMHGAFMLNLGYLSIENRAKSIPIPYLIWDKIPFYLQQEIVWNYGAGVAAKNYLSPRNEKLLWYVKDPTDYFFDLDSIRDPDVAYPNQKKKGKLRCNSIGKNPSDVWQIAKVTSGANRASAERTSHPAQFPLDLCERVIKGFSERNGIVLDPFLGSGSTVDACLRLGRYSIGIEIRRDYCDIAAKRISDSLSQTSLF